MPEGVEIHVVRLEEKIIALSEQVKEIRGTVDGVRETVDAQAQNAAKERLTIILAFVAGWLSLMVAVVSSYVHK